jgi:hypothetical protein
MARTRPKLLAAFFYFQVLIAARLAHLRLGQ